MTTVPQTVARPDAVPATSAHRVRSAATRLVRAELRLAVREPLVLTFVLAFPIITMLIIGNSFGTEPDPAFGGTDPSQWYVASYFTVVIASVGLVMLPVHLAAYRERGVLRRFAVAGFPRWSMPLAELVLGLVTIAVAGVALLLVALPVFGVPGVHSVWRVTVAVVLGAVAFVAVGVLLGTLLPSARSAQAVGMLLFFPSFLLGAGGPPPGAIGDTMTTIADALPLTWVTRAVREPWLGIGDANAQLVAVAVLAMVASALAFRRSSLGRP